MFRVLRVFRVFRVFQVLGFGVYLDPRSMYKEL